VGNRAVTRIEGQNSFKYDKSLIVKRLFVFHGNVTLS